MISAALPRMRPARLLASLALAGELALPGRAWANDVFVAPLEHDYVELDAAYDHYAFPPLFTSPTVSVDNAALDLAAQIKVHRHVALTLDIPWAVGEETDIPGVHAAVGNILVGVRGFGHVLPNLLLWGGLTGAIPTMYRYSSVPASVLGFASFSGGLFGYDRFTPELASARAFFGLEAAFASTFRERFEVTALLLLDADENASPNAIPALAFFDELEARLPRDFLVGIRLQYFAFDGHGTLGATGDELYCLAGGVYAGYEAPYAGLFVRLGLLIAPFPFVSVSETAQLRVGYRF